MRRIAYTIAFLIAAVPGALGAQSVTASQATQVETGAPSSLRDQLMPASAGLMVTAPATAEVAADMAVNQPVMQRRGGMPYMIAGGALLVAGLLIGGNAGTLVAVGGAVIGAYGLYLYF